ncbi:RidA family protein [Pedobacter nototheniae]|uniref:RidA family protein n=1 Tax=Pedobacter nototheniae TaxID=2488994 RepID=UPI00103B22C8|nr:RidA family protein [Pedobacter nototheniae]
MNEKYRGTTVNERLYLSGTLNKFDKAVEEKDIDEVIRILKNVDVDDNSIKAILKQMGLTDRDT